MDSGDGGDSVHAVARAGFGQRGYEEYERGRPSYPDAVLQHLRARLPLDAQQHAHVVDLAAGTGKMTRLLAPLAHRVTAVEPAAGFRAKIEEQAQPHVTAVAGTATSIPLPDASADGMVTAQAFHWFATREALTEMARVLKPGAALALVWNISPWNTNLDSALPGALLRPPRPLDDGDHGSANGDGDAARPASWILRIHSAISECTPPNTPQFATLGWVKALVEDRQSEQPNFGEWHTELVNNVSEPLGEDDMWARFSSISYIAAMPDEARERLRARLRGILEQDHPEFGPNGSRKLVMPYATVVYTARRLDHSHALDDRDMAAYAQRVALPMGMLQGSPAPSLDLLTAIHKAHCYSIPFENLTIQLGLPVAMDEASVWDKLVRLPRGGYCFEQNALLRSVLRHLGFTVEDRIARVWINHDREGRDEPGVSGIDLADPPAQLHHCLIVPIAGERWLCDVGFGAGGIQCPLRIHDGSEATQPNGDQLRLVLAQPSGATPRGPAARWMLVGLDDAGKWHCQYEFTDSEPAYRMDFFAGNVFVQVHPSLPFRDSPILTRPVEKGGRVSAFGLRVRRRTRTPAGGTETHEEVIRTAAQYRDMLRDSFGIDVSAVEAEKIFAAGRAGLAEQRTLG